MKRFLLHRLSLTKQLIAIMLFFSTSLMFFFIVIINNNINKLISQQITRNISESQDIFLHMYSYNTGYEIRFNEYFENIPKDRKVYHYLISNFDLERLQRKEIQIILSDTDVDELTWETMLGHVYYQEIGATDYITKSVESHENIYYRITKMDGYSLISYMHGDSFDSLATRIRMAVTNNTIIVITVLFIIIFIWVTSLLIPLVKIKNYIEALRNKSTPTKLDIKREDEIGLVGEALNAMTSEIEKQENARKEMMHNISHDLKTPIAVIKTYGESIKDNIFPYGSLEKTVDVIIDNATRLEKKVQNLLYLNQLDYLKDSGIVVNNFNMAELIDKVCLQMKVLSRDIKLETNLETVEWQGEIEKWQIVLENLIDNGFRYSKTIIKIELTQDQLIIYNDGEKISDEIIDSLFQPYIKGNKGKFGLGLSIVHTIVNMYGYKIKVENIDDGVKFVIFR